MIISRLVAKRILLLEINAVERLYNVLRKSHEQLIDINYNYPWWNIALIYNKFSLNAICLIKKTLRFHVKFFNNLISLKHRFQYRNYNLTVYFNKRQFINFNKELITHFDTPKLYIKSHTSVRCKTRNLILGLIEISLRKSSGKGGGFSTCATAPEQKLTLSYRKHTSSPVPPCGSDHSRILPNHVRAHNWELMLSSKRKIYN